MAENISLYVTTGSVVALLLVLKFVSSMITKLLLIAICVAIGYVGFTQRDALKACVQIASAQAKAGTPVDTQCTVLGRKVHIALPSLP